MTLGITERGLEHCYEVVLEQCDGDRLVVVRLDVDERPCRRNILMSVFVASLSDSQTVLTHGARDRETAGSSADSASVGSSVPTGGAEETRLHRWEECRRTRC